MILWVSMEAYYQSLHPQIVELEVVAPVLVLAHLVLLSLLPPLHLQIHLHSSELDSTKHIDPEGYML